MSSSEETSKDLYRESFKYYKSFSLPTTTTVIPPSALKSDKRRRQEKVSNPKHGGGGGFRGGGTETKSMIDEWIGNNNIVLPQPSAQYDSQQGSETSCVTKKDIQSCNECDCYKLYGLRSPETWKVAQLTFPQGLIVIRNPFTPAGQRYWISRTLLDFPHHAEYITNMDNLHRLQRIQDGEPADCLADFKLDTCSKDFYAKLRWVTFGYHHDWDTKIYSEGRRSDFPEDLAEMTRYISRVLGFSDFKAEAAIANYYHMDSTLAGHVDRSEANQGAPLFSLSFGQTAIFLIGGRTKFERPQPVLLRSGDVAVMSGESRLSFHGVPKILPAGPEPWSENDDIETNSENLPNNCDTINLASPCKRQKLNSSSGDIVIYEKLQCVSCNASEKMSTKEGEWTPFVSKYISQSRINLNIRQVLFPGQTTLFSEAQNIDNDKK